MKVTALIKVNDHYESPNGKYTVIHRTGFRSINDGKYSRKAKRDEWELRDNESFKKLNFPTLKLAEHYIVTGEYRAF